MDIGLYIAMQVLILMMHLTAELIKLAGFLLRVLIELSCKLRLLPCVLYAAVVAIFFEPWAEAHTILALGILIALGVLAAASWIYTFAGWMRKRRLEDEVALYSMMANSRPLQMETENKP